MEIQIELAGFYCNHWPNLRIDLNNQQLFCGEVEEQMTLTFEVDCFDKNQLVFEHFGKKFGEQGVYDTVPEQSLDCKLQITDVKFDKVSIGPKLRSALSFRTIWSSHQIVSQSQEFVDQYSLINETDGWMAFNGKIVFEFETPIYDWLIIKKFKVEEEATDKAFYSNFTTRWHYKQDLAVLEEIRKLMGFNEDFSDRSTKT